MMPRPRSWNLEPRPKLNPNIPSIIQDGKLIIRGTMEWETRELKRKLEGCNCLSFGAIPTRFRQRKQLAILRRTGKGA